MIELGKLSGKAVPEHPPREGMEAGGGYWMFVVRGRSTLDRTSLKIL